MSCAELHGRLRCGRSCRPRSASARARRRARAGPEGGRGAARQSGEGRSEV